MTLKWHPLYALKSLRIARGVKAVFLASAIGVTEQSYFRYENGSRRMYLDKALVIAKTLGVTIEDLGRTDAAIDAPITLDHLPAHALTANRTPRNALGEQAIENTSTGSVVSVPEEHAPFELPEGWDQF